MTQNGICIVSAFNVLNSSNKGQRRGTLIMVRLLDASIINNIENILGTKISIEAMPDDEIAIISADLANNNQAVKPLNDKQVAGYSIIKTINNDTKLVISAVSDRKEFEQGKSSLSYIY